MKKNVKLLTGGILYVVFTILMIVVISLKTNYYIDEIYSYGLANGTGEGIDIIVEYDKTYTPAASAYEDYMQVQKGEQFNYASVWENQANDVHPPLYYAILHTICSVFPNTFSKWYAGVINIIFALLSLAVMRKLIALLTDSKYILSILSFSFIFVAGILNASSYFRMYLVAMLWVTLLTYLFARQVDEKHTRSFYFRLYLVTVAGALTHYYTIVYAVLISCVYGVYLLWNKRGKDTLLFCVTMALAGGTSVAVFPAMIQHMFFGYRGTEAIDKLAAGNGYWMALKIFFDIINRQMFGKMLGFILIGLVIAAIIRYSQNHLSVLEEMEEESISFGMDSKTVIRYILIFVPSISYFMMIARMTFATVDRYIYPIYAVVYAGVMCIGYTVVKYFLRNRTFVVVSIVTTALLVGGSYASMEWTWLFKDTQPFIETVEQHSDYDCVCVLAGDVFMLYPEFEEYSNYKSITFITIEELREKGIGKYAASAPDGLVVSYIGVPDHEALTEQFTANYGYMGFEKLGTFGFDNTYFLYN